MLQPVQRGADQIAAHCGNVGVQFGHVTHTGKAVVAMFCCGVECVPCCFWTDGIFLCGDEGGMFMRGVIGNEVQQDAHAPAMHFLNKLLQRLVCAVAAGDVEIIGRVIAVAAWAFKDGRKPDTIGTEGLNVI